MSDDKVLSKEEVDALFKASKDNGSDLEKIDRNLVEGDQEWSESAFNKKILSNIVNLTTAECEKNLTSFLRKKLTMSHKKTDTKKLSDYMQENTNKQVYTLFQITPNDQYGMVALDLPFLYHAISLLYGGQNSKDEPIFENPGKVGLVVAEKIAQSCIDGFTVTAHEYGQLECQTIKTITQPNLSSKLNVEDSLYIFEMSLHLGELESTVTFMIMENFFKQFLTVNAAAVKHVESNFWRSAIETQVADSFVEVQAILPSISIKLNDLVAMKNGSLIPISDPTLVYISLNELKLFRANAGQANAKRVAKIISEV